MKRLHLNLSIGVSPALHQVMHDLYKPDWKREIIMAVYYFNWSNLRYWSSRVLTHCILILLFTVILSCKHQSQTPDSLPLASAVSEDGIRIVYSIVGSGEPTLVFIHGWTCDRSFWRYQIPHFATNYRIISIDLAGHGGSESGRIDWTVQNFGADVAAVVRSARAQRVVLIGHSLGGPVAVEAALLLQDQTVAVIGVDTFWDNWAGSWVERRCDKLRVNYLSSFKEFVRKGFVPTSDTALITLVTNSMAAAPSEMAIPVLSNLGKWTRERSDSAYAMIRVPVGVLQTSETGFTRLEAHRLSLPALDVMIMSGVGHFLMLEDPERFNALLEAQLCRLLSMGKSNK